MHPAPSAPTTPTPPATRPPPPSGATPRDCSRLRPVGAKDWNDLLRRPPATLAAAPCRRRLHRNHSSLPQHATSLCYWKTSAPDSLSQPAPPTLPPSPFCPSESTCNSAASTAETRCDSPGATIRDATRPRRLLPPPSHAPPGSAPGPCRACFPHCGERHPRRPPAHPAANSTQRACLLPCSAHRPYCNKYAAPLRPACAAQHRDHGAASAQRPPKQSELFLPLNLTCNSHPTPPLLSCSSPPSKIHTI